MDTDKILDRLFEDWDEMEYLINLDKSFRVSDLFLSVGNNLYEFKNVLDQTLIGRSICLKDNTGYVLLKKFAIKKVIITYDWDIDLNNINKNFEILSLSNSDSNKEYQVYFQDIIEIVS